MLPSSRNCQHCPVDQQPCCEDCESWGDDASVFQCFSNCQHCVSGTKCLSWSSDAADGVAQAACWYAYNMCPDVSEAAAVAMAIGGDFAVTRQQCYQASKNVCETDARSYAQSGGSGCSAYNTGTSSCDAWTFQGYFETKMNELCDMVASGLVVSLP
ncbi:hypothetical protein PLESTM_000306100 [Pleodorina starrii]|nr:hypothetical protein PLESTM_000306100 [Pleodorina starrii]